MFPSSCSLSLKPPPPKYSDFTGYGWVILICSFILYVIVDGIAYNLGLVNSAWLAEFEESETATSWIGSIFYSVPLLSAPITAHLVENFGCKTITIICSFISTFGFVMSSFCGSIEQLYVTVGLIAGFGVSAGYVVGILSAERWFEKKRTLAIGIVSSGTGFGTFVIAPTTQRLLDAFGWRNTMYFLASLNVLMGFVGCFIREPQWVIDEMKKKGVKDVKNNENHGIFEENETSFGTFRRLSTEAIEDLKDVVRSRFSVNYSHLEEVIEEKGQNNDKSEVMSEDICKNEAEISSVNEVRSHTSKESEVMSLNLPQVQKIEVSSSQSQQASTENELEYQISEVMSHNSATIPPNSHHTSSRHNIENIEQQFIVNDSQERNSLENNVNIIKTESNSSHSAYSLTKKCHASHDEIENESMSVHLPQAEDEYYQEEILGSSGDCETLTSINESEGLQDDQLFTICGQNLGNHPENLKICDHNGKVYVSEERNLKNKHQNPESGMHHSNFDEHNLKYKQYNFKNQHNNLQTESCPEIEQQNVIISKRSQENLKHEQHNLKGRNFSRSLQIPKPGQQFDRNSYSETCYKFENVDTNQVQPELNKPQISTIIYKFVKEKFKVVMKIFSHFSNRDFTLLAISTFAIYSLYNIPIYFIIELLKNFGYTESQCASYISLIGISILIGMITLGYIGDVSGIQVKNVNAFCVLVCGIAEILLPMCAVNSIAFGICCVFFGFSFASAYVLIPKIAEMIVGVDEFASAIGLNFFVQGLALLVGIPFASTIYEAIGR